MFFFEIYIQERQRYTYLKYINKIRAKERHIVTKLYNCRRTMVLLLQLGVAVVRGVMTRLYRYTFRRHTYIYIPTHPK